ncbi:MAG: MBL fold metallo-hydrolase RNA specificity domain-containing protein [Candidatus Limnocylindrales bacterium]
MATHIHFLGGAATVTGSQYLLETDRAKVVIDCGLFQGPPDIRVRNLVPLGYDPATIDAMLLTHAHLDHCGLIPYVVKAGYRGPIYATAGTIELATLVLLDSGRLQEQFAKREMRWEKRHPDLAVADDRAEQEEYLAAVDLAAAGEALVGSPALASPGDMRSGEHIPTIIEPEPTWVAPTRPAGHTPHGLAHDPDLDPDAVIYTERDARASLASFRPVRYTEETEVAPGVHARFVDAGHILGSAIIVVRVEGEDAEAERTIVFSGDLGRPGAPILRDYTTVTEADYVLVETTYGGREHEPNSEALAILAEAVRLVAENDGVLLVPSFAIGRTQELIYELDRLIDRGEIPLLPLYLDSPMGSKATEVYRRHPDFYDEVAAQLVLAHGSPLDYPNQIVTDDFRDSQQIAFAPRPHMIIASNGMLTGGRVVGHLQRLIVDPKATLLFVGYQAEGTLGASLQAGAKTARVNGQIVNVHCRVRSISGFSAHADEPQLLAWLANFRGRSPRRVFLVHGEPEGQAAIEPKIQALGLPTAVPRWRERITLD